VALKGKESKSKKSKKRGQQEHPGAADVGEEADEHDNETGLEGDGGRSKAIDE
jgi:hypothetical protein